MTASPKPRMRGWERVAQVVGIVVFVAMLLAVAAIVVGLIVRALMAVWA